MLNIKKIEILKQIQSIDNEIMKLEKLDEEDVSPQTKPKGLKKELAKAY